MGTRIKTFDSTGQAPNGRLFAGDMNAIQDQYADQNNLGQNVGVNTIALGEAGLQMVRYGPGEMRITGSVRTDGILRGLGGLYAGAYTTAQRDGIAAGSRPYGLIVLNTTTNQYEWNSGTDAAPNWKPMSPPVVEVPVGGGMDWPWAAAQIPSWAILSYGQAISRTTYAALANLASLSAYPYGNGDGSTTFNVADRRGRVGVGKDDMGGVAANRITAGISGASGATLGAVFGAEGISLTTAQLPAHNHGVTDNGHAHGVSDNGHYHQTQIHSAYDGPGPTGWADTVRGYLMEWGSAGGGYPDATWYYPQSDTKGTGIVIQVGGTGISIQNAGGGGVHQNTQPSIIVNKILRAL